MVKKRFLPGMGCLLVMGLAGCHEIDPSAGTYSWHPTGINAANLAAQVANPNDLRYGHDDGGYSYGAPQAVAIDRIMTDKPKKLPSMTNFSVGNGGRGGGSGSGSGGGGGGDSSGGSGGI